MVEQFTLASFQAPATLLFTLMVTLYTLNLLVWAFKKQGTSSFRWRYCLIRLHQTIVSVLTCKSCRRCCCAPLPWTDPQTPSSGNVLPAHVPLRTYADPTEALGNGSFPFHPTISPEERHYIKSTREMSLDGVWRFKLYPRPDAIKGAMPPNVPDFKSLGTTTINVPGCWEQQSFGVPIYTNIQYPWLSGPKKMCGGNVLSGYHAGSVPDDNPTGLYHRTFTLPSSWCKASKDRTIVLHLGSVASAARVFVNGIEVGFFKDSFTETEIDVTQAVESIGHGQKHSIGLQVMRFSDGSWLEDQDHWWLSGIHRSIYLQSRPKKHTILNYNVRTTLEPNNNTTRGTLVVDVKIGTVLSAKDTEEKIQFMLYDVSDALDPSKGISVVEYEYAPINTDKATTSVTATLRCGNIKTWSPESPYLYTLIMYTSTHCEMTRVGFRECKVATVKTTATGGSQEISGSSGTLGKEGKQQYFMLNGVPQVVAGVNYHEHDRHTGKTIDNKGYARDLWMMKNANFNAVRTCHYPHDHRFYELCNEIGLMVCDEANIETHGFSLTSQMSYLTCHPDWRKAFLNRVSSMAQRSQHYTCIVTWSLGNESGYGPNHEACATMLRQFDATRPLQYEGGRKHGDAVFILGTGHGPATVTDFICPMYHSPAELSLVSSDTGETRPIVLCEYLHAMGNSSGNSHIYWDAFWDFGSSKTRSMQGGYVWDWVDQALVDSRDPNRIMCYGGDFDIYEDTGDAGDAQFCINGLIFADRSPHPAVKELWYLQSPIKVSYNNAGAILTISNRYRFLSLDHLQFAWSITSTPINNNHNNHNNANNGSPLVLREGMLDLSRMTHQEDENPAFMPGGHYHGPMPFTLDDIQLLKDKHGWDHTHANDPHLYLNVRVELTQAEQQRGWNHSPQQERLVVSECFALFDRSSLHNPVNTPATTMSSGKGNKAHVSEVNKQQLVVKGKKYEIVFAKETGKFVQMTDRGSNTPLILGCDHAFYRAATDNDKGGLSESAVGANTMELLTLMDRVCGTSLTTEGPSATSFHGQWEKYGLHNVEAIAVEPVTVIKGHVLIQNDRIVSALSKEPLFFVRTTWSFYQEEYTMDVEVTVGKGLPASLLSLPRIGMHFELPASYTTMQYEGRGPNECYADRKASNPPGLWEMTVDEGHVPYVVPSENGGRCDVTSLTVRSNDKNKSTFKMTYEQVDEEPPPKEQPLTGLFIHKGGHAGEVRKRPAGVKGAQINLSRYSVEELNRARHDDELVGRRKGQERDVAHKTVHLHVDTAHMGVGGDTGWTPETHLQYRISPAGGNVWKYRLTVEVV